MPSVSPCWTRSGITQGSAKNKQIQTVTVALSLTLDWHDPNMIYHKEMYWIWLPESQQYKLFDCLMMVTFVQSEHVTWCELILPTMNLRLSMVQRWSSQVDTTKSPLLLPLWTHLDALYGVVKQWERFQSFTYSSDVWNFLFLISFGCHSLSFKMANVIIRLTEGGNTTTHFVHIFEHWIIPIWTVLNFHWKMQMFFFGS